MSLSIEVNDVINIDGEELHFQHRTLAGDLCFKNRATAAVKTIPLDEALARFSRGELTLRVSTDDANIKTIDISKLHADYRKIVDQRLAFVKAILFAGKPKNMRLTWPSIIQGVAAIQGVHAPTWTTVRRWVRRYEDNCGDARCLIPAFSGRGRKAHYRSDGETDFLNNLITQCMTAELAPTVVTIHGIITAKYAEIKAVRADTVLWDCPSIDWLYKHLRRVDAYDRARLQQGQKYAEEHYGKVGKGVAATFRLEVVEIDHTRANASVKDDVTGIDLGRPWITIAIDRFTRMVVGLYIGFEPPSTYSVGQCLRNLIMPKSYLKELCPELMLSWDAYGLPVTVIVDNAMEFRSDWFRNVGASLGFDIHQQPVDKPAFKGIVERFNKSLEDGAMILPNRTFGSVAARGKRKPQKGASLTLAQFRSHVHFWIVAVYCNRTHEGILDVPARRWNEDVKRHPLRLPTSARDLDFVLGITKRAKLSRLGVRSHNLFFNSTELSRLYSRIGAETVDVTIDPADISRAIVTYAPEHLQITVPCTDQEYAKGLTLHQHNLIRALARKRNAAFLNQPDRIAARNAFFLASADMMERSSGRHRAKHSRGLGDEKVKQPSNDLSLLASLILEPQDDLDLQAVLAEDSVHVALPSESLEALSSSSLPFAASLEQHAPMEKTSLAPHRQF
ncbi:MAG: transposase family protein [Rhodospirillaceae bacterium]|nr:transposase family protein [Rhodospirillaceae bacterium]